MSVALPQIACLHITWRFHTEEDSDLVGWGSPCLFNKLPWIHVAGPGTTLWPGLRGGGVTAAQRPSHYRICGLQRDRALPLGVFGPVRLRTVVELSWCGAADSAPAQPVHDPLGLSSELEESRGWVTHASTCKQPSN